MTEGILFRTAEPGDAAEIGRLLGELGYETPTAELAPRLAACLAAAERACFVAARRPGEVLGWVEVAVHLSLVHEPEAVLLGLVVDERARGSGIGAELVRRAEEWGRVRGLRTARLHSRATRTLAHGFYEHLGYERVKTQVLFRRGL